MNTSRLSRLVLFLLAPCAGAFAADLIKADNTTALNTDGSYTTAGTPTNATVIVFDNTLAGNFSFATGGSINARGLRVDDPAGDIALNIGNATLSLGVNNSTSGSINLSAATSNLSISGGGTLRFYGASPSISVASGRTVTVNSKTTLYNDGTLTISGDGAVNLNGNITETSTNSTIIHHTGSGTLTLGGTNTYIGGTVVDRGVVAISNDFSMGAASANGFGLDASTGTSGQITFGGGTLTLGGTLALTISGTFATNTTFDLFDFGAGASAGDLSAISIAGTYSGNLTSQGSGIWSGVIGGDTFNFNEATGDLTVFVGMIPEPSAFAIFAGLSTLGLAALRRRR